MLNLFDRNAVFILQMLNDPEQCSFHITVDGANQRESSVVFHEIKLHVFDVNLCTNGNHKLE